MLVLVYILLWTGNNEHYCCFKLVCCMCACLCRIFSTTTALCLDGWSFSSACSCLMNPAVCVLIECFLCSHVLHYPIKSHHPSHTFSSFVREVNKGSLMSHTGPGKQTMTRAGNTTLTCIHIWRYRKEKRTHLQLKCWLFFQLTGCIFLWEKPLKTISKLMLMVGSWCWKCQVF